MNCFSKNLKRMSQKEPDDLWKRLGLEEWVSIDLETTGLDAGNDEIIEIGAVKFLNGIEVDRFNQLVKPSIDELPKFIVELTGITDDDLESAPAISSIADEFISFVSDLPVLGQNVGFDLSFLRSYRYFKDHFRVSRILHRTYDTKINARFLAPCLDGNGLGYLCRKYGIKLIGAHRAVNDAEATGNLFALQLKMFSAIDQKQISDGLHFTKTTQSPLRNVLQRVLTALSSGYISTSQPPSIFEESNKNRTNHLIVKGDPRPEKPATSEQISQLFHTAKRFDTTLKSYEVRHEQVNMAVYTAQALNEGNLTVIEAGTGVGKSMGYLVPALLSGQRIVVSTNTKNLQDQLFYEEIPRLGKIFKFGFKAALLKGRRNYLCQTRWRNLVLDPERLPSQRLRESAATLIRWVDETRTGDISEVSGLSNSGYLLKMITSEPGFCTGKSCNGKCPLSSIRKKAISSDITIVNHSLVLSDMNSESSLFGDDARRMIIDEAHHFEDVATDMFSTDVSFPVLRMTLERTVRLCKTKGTLCSNLSVHSSLKRIVDSVEKVGRICAELIEPANIVFQILGGKYRKQVPEDVHYSTSFRYKLDDSTHSFLKIQGDVILAGLKGVTNALERLYGKVEAEVDETFPPEVMQEMRASFEDLKSQCTALEYSLLVEDDNRVYWIEVPPDLNESIHLKTAPLEVDKLLADGLWSKLKSAILTSATLATGPGGKGFDHLISRLGLKAFEDRLRTAAFGSPFDYQKNCQVCYTSYLSSPAEQPEYHTQEVAELCKWLIHNQPRGILVLFTSYRAMKAVDRILAKDIKNPKFELLTQRGALGRDRLIRKFRNANGKAILLGTNSFWEGIDLPGSVLQIVIITKIPFEVPSDPIVAARIEQIRHSGGNPFFDFQLPRALLKVRQGAGRLIRTATDRGIVIVLDQRVFTKGYGKRVQAIINGRAQDFKDERDLYDSIDGFFGK